jgi:ribosomal protein L7/L12
MDDTARINALQLKVAELERRLNFVMDQLKLEYAAAPLNPALAEAANWLRKGEKMEAIKVYQKMTGLGLKEARDAVVALEQKLNTT